MAWECAVCNRRESEREDSRIDVVCHHCGKPLCGADRVSLLDDAFSDQAGPVSRTAYHCPDCRAAHHQRLGTSGWKHE